MGKSLFILMFLLANVAFAQVKDNFGDGNFSADPAWLGSVSGFQVNAGQQLQSTGASVSQTIGLATANAYATNVKWEFFMQMNFDPSATNLARIYLVADKEDLTGALNGYFLQVGESGNTDSYDLYKQTGNTIAKIIDGAPKARSSVNQLQARIRVTRDSHGAWHLYTDNTGGENFILEGMATDVQHIGTSWFGVYCRYTATRSAGFIFDDFTIEELVPDTTPPTLVSVNVIDQHTLEAVFSEPVTSASATAVGNYSLGGLYGNPTNVVTTNAPNVYRLTFLNNLVTDNYQLVVVGVKDLKGNEILQGSQVDFFYIKPYVAKLGDVVINEIMADPTPQIGLPNAEFVELWNTTNEYILLNGWKYGDQTATFTFGTDTIKPNSYIILCPNGAASELKSFGKVISLSSWPSLNNDKDWLQLTADNGTLIDQVAYTNAWYKDELKKQGGYTLELIDPKNICTGIQNWAASSATTGGTPGAVNSVYQSQYSNIAPNLLVANIIDATTVLLVFDKSVDSLSAAGASNYSLNNGIGPATHARPMGPAFNQVEVKFGNEIIRGAENLLTVTGVRDCAGNLVNPDGNTARIFWAKEVSVGDLLISEVLFNPKMPGVDYVEVYNNSGHVLDLKDMQLANIGTDGNPANIKAFSNASIFIQPGTYWVLTANPAVVKQQYNVKYPSQFVQLSSLPNFNNDNGTVLLLRGDMVVDRLDYTNNMHTALLRNEDGVALERLSFDKPANFAGNFGSAAQSVGFGTPTYQNSQMAGTADEKEGVTLVSKTFSPDGDGFEDLLSIGYRFEQPGKFATINIYTDKGRQIRRLQNNASIGASGSFVWDGLSDTGQLCAVGIYIIRFEVFALNGQGRTFTKTCVLATRL